VQNAELLKVLLVRFIKTLNKMKKYRIARMPGYNPTYSLTHPWELIFDFVREVKYFIQRGLYGYAESDHWSLDYYLSSWVPNALREMKDCVGFGTPGTLVKDPQTATDKEWNEAEKEWGKIVDKMIAGFEAPIKQDELGYSTKKQKEKFREEWDKLEKIRIEGMELFVKYYQSLWD